MEGVALNDIADQFGTPCYVYSKDALSQNFMAYKNALGDRNHLICYAVKSNSNIAVLKLLGDMGAGADVVSSGELIRALKAGIPSNKIVFSGVGKTKEEITHALGENILQINVHCSQYYSRQLAVQHRLSIDTLNNINIIKTRSLI